MQPQAAKPMKFEAPLSVDFLAALKLLCHQNWFA
jgi:hypothetical protein